MLAINIELASTLYFRNNIVDLLKVVLAFMVVAIHTQPLTNFGGTGYQLLVDGLLRVAVPLFLITNGFFFYKKLMANSVRTWLVRLLVLYVFWMAIYLPFYFPQNADGLTLANFFRILLFGYFHLWYLIGTLGAGILSSLIRGWGVVRIGLLICVLFFVGCSLQYLGYYWKFDSKLLNLALGQHWPYRNFVFFGLPFFYSGILIAKYELYKFPLKTLGSLVVVGFVLFLIEMLLNFRVFGATEAFDMYFSLLIFCPAVFCFILLFSIKGDFFPVRFSSAVYMIHPLIIFLGTVWFDRFGGSIFVFTIIGVTLVAWPLSLPGGIFKKIF